MSIRPARIRAIVMAILVLAFVIPWTYAHIAYAWPWKEQSTGDACTGRYYLTPYDEHRPINLGTLSDGRTVFMGMTGKVSMGRKIGSFGLSASNNNN
ncbi:MAG: DNA-binding protein, partial [Schaalia odontolytica]|nr:DNA-binding protein [Schaalia odontolytica]